MNIEEYNTIVNKDYFTVCRTDKTRSGIWTDMTIEQTLMRKMKTVDGLIEEK